jgi:hypothetical protein
MARLVSSGDQRGDSAVALTLSLNEDLTPFPLSMFEICRDLIFAALVLLDCQAANL